MLHIMTCITVKLSLLLCMVFYDAISTFSLYASTGTYFHIKLLKLLVKNRGNKDDQNWALKSPSSKPGFKEAVSYSNIGNILKVGP